MRFTECLLACAASAPLDAYPQSGILIQHRDANNPVSEGRILSEANGNLRFGPASDDPGMESWSVATDGVETAVYVLRIGSEDSQAMTA